MDDILNGYYKKYVCSENLYTKYAIFECAKLQHNKCDINKKVTDH